ncbi:sigma factor G inhibitor Gin [Marinicrinis lubricantis]|uniref:Sigma factor G inhibitor Gin n=1 Tax=Marinicrinis lubricantis TaxID=2086470 RepID=A0ABW1IR86_9BACL
MEPLQHCIICDGDKKEGIHIYTSFICLDCEKEIVGTDVLDLKYPFFIRQLKQIWWQKDA